MQIRARRYVYRAVVTTALGLACVPTICHAQESTLAAHPSAPLLGAIAVPSLSATNDVVSAGQPIDAPHASISRATETMPPRHPGVLLPLYASFAGLQMLDAHSTMRALQNGGVEANPLLRGLAGRPAAFVAMKAGVTASTIVLTERLRPKHRAAAIALMVALDSFYAMVVVHNYRAVP